MVRSKNEKFKVEPYAIKKKEACLYGFKLKIFFISLLIFEVKIKRNLLLLYSQGNDASTC